ncbi:aminopeptidase [Marinisporobacter balticus]|uniref:M18 family aminopeptidase n=1 Tax=Marinisporobacter balticus TaxID=2018667 RepID=A0A4R2KZ26_9FIRM|nr:aminopeptidase [Marinisporobacter balticus]TCO79354.1 aspartyl aminopeptidase [Marinisporobacter balticus]
MSGKIEEKRSNDELGFEFKNGWEKINELENKEVFQFNEGYKCFLNNGKTERACVKEIIIQAQANGYKDMEDFINGKEVLKEGDKIYVNNKGKGVALFIIGEEPIEQGMHIIGAHIDSPRLDLKPYPLYEDGGLALLKTHYYGGIKKYQWTAIPLAIHGILINKNGEKINIVVGEEDTDPVFFITDLLPHLSKNQNEKKMSEGITGEGLNVLVGSMPYEDKETKERVKYNILKLLNDKYGIEEQDFLTAEIEIVPAGKAKDVGFDKSLIGSYGQDDRVCSYTAMKAIFEIDKPKKTAVALLVDKEEIGSMGNTGMQSRFFENVVAELVALQSEDLNFLKVRRALANSKVLSADVGAGFDPNFPDVLDKRNAAYIGKGILVSKYTGSRGKSGSNDANAEYLAQIRKIFNENDILWQIGELGKVDQGGGGTIAYILANYGAEVVDCGVPLLNMHAPMEIASKIDIYMAYKGYKAFLEA